MLRDVLIKSIVSGKISEGPMTSSELARDIYGYDRRSETPIERKRIVENNLREMEKMGMIEMRRGEVRWVGGET